MSSRRWTMLLPLAALAAGCAISQTAEVAEYRALLDLPEARQAPAEPLTLREALLLANASNETLSARGEQFLRALIERRRTAAAFAPTVRLVGAAIRRDPLPDFGGEPIEGDETSAAVDGELTWNLFNGMRDVNRYWGDQFRIDRQRNILLDAQEGLLLDVATVFYQILRSEATVRVLENSLVVQDERLLNTRTRLEVGFARSLDVAQTEAQAAETRSTLINARRDVVNARDLLALLINQPVADRPLDEQSPLPEVAEPLDRYLAAAASMRNDIAAAEAAIEAARRDVEVAFGQYYPTVTLNLDTFLYSTPVPNERDWSALLSASVPIFTAGRTHADVREAWSFVREAMLLRDFQRRLVEQQVRQAHNDLAASRARVAQLEIQLAAAEQAFEQAEASYSVGLATNLDRVVAQDALLLAQLQLSSERYELRIFTIRLLRAAGLLREAITPAAPPGLDQMISHTPAPATAVRLEPAS